MLIDTSSSLDAALATLSKASCLALDTEFMRESTYFPQPCLIQVASSDACVLIDPLAFEDLTPLFALLQERSRIKVLHAARQDLEVLGLAGGLPPPGPIFDTQIAAALLGLPTQIGYGDLVAQRLGVTLPKGHARTDWSRRPLLPEQLAYAMDDVRYLPPLYTDLKAALATAGRLDWLEEETRLLENSRLYRVTPEEAWKRLKGLDQLAPASRVAARLLAEWREQRAIRHNKPRGWILHDDTLRDLAERLPDSLDALTAIRSMPAATIRKHGKELLELLRLAHDKAVDEPPPTTFVRPAPEQLTRIKRTIARLRELAAQLDLSPELLATRRDVEQLVLRGDPGILAKGWRQQVIGKVLEEFRL